MSQTMLATASVSLLLLLSGCGLQTEATNKIASPAVNQAANSSTSTKTTVKDNPVPDANWVLTDTLVKQTKWFTQYNQNLSINHGVYGKTVEYWHWQLPSTWQPYLYKNEHYITPKTGPVYLNHQTLFITLQGTVYLKEGIAGRYWPPFSPMDIPPDATIVAEFVPLKPAVKAGIIPVFHGGPQAPGTRYIEPAALKVLGMTKTEFVQDIGNQK